MQDLTPMVHNGAFDPWKLRGLKIGTVGLLVTILGFLLFLTDLKIVGRVVIYFGFIIVFIGIAVHIYLLLRRKAR